MKRVAWTALALTGVLLYGCTGVGGGQRPAPEEEAPVEDKSVEAAEGERKQAEGAETGTAELDDPARVSPLEDPDSPLSKRVIYFDFDSSDISADDRRLLAHHGEFLAEHPDVSVVLEGHADERGSREYNLALGERRSKAVERLLVLQGAGGDQLQVISFGEERPVARGHDESAWSLNRRVELLYSGY